MEYWVNEQLLHNTGLLQKLALKKIRSLLQVSLKLKNGLVDLLYTTNHRIIQVGRDLRVSLNQSPAQNNVHYRFRSGCSEFCPDAF